MAQLIKKTLSGFKDKYIDEMFDRIIRRLNAGHLLPKGGTETDPNGVVAGDKFEPYVGSDGSLWINTSAASPGTTWTKIGP